MAYGFNIEVLCGVIQGVSVGIINILGDASMDSDE